MIPILIWLSFIFLNILWGIFSSDVVNRQKKDAIYKPIKHGWWGLAYVGFMSISLTFLPVGMELFLLLIAVSLLHLSVFPVTYNAFQELPLFNLSKTSKALTDRLMVAAGLNDTEAVNISALIVSAALLTLSLLIS